MSLDLTPEQKAAGKTNFEQAAGDLARAGKLNTMVTGDGKPLPPPPKDGEYNRRDVLKAGLAVGAVVPVSAAVYFGYTSWKAGNPVRMALIGCGDEGGVLVGDHNPEYNKIVAVCDIRPTNLDRIFDGDTGPRKGLTKVYGEEEAAKIKRFKTVDELLAAKDELKLEAVIIATPLNTHDAITKACMDKGLHVMCEKLMARTIKRCKEMTLYAQEKGLLLSIGHQRHYSTLYATALEMLEQGILGDIKYIRALWHRNNSWPYDPKAFNNEKFDAKYGIPAFVDSWWKEVPKKDAEAFEKLTPEEMNKISFGDREKHGFKDAAELVRWRCSEKTGGGLMAELGSHQLDASSIILGHVRPLAVMGVGGKFFYGRGTDPSHGNDRESDDGVFVTFEFPGRTYYKRDKDGHLIKENGKPVKDPANENDVVVVTFSSFNTNEFEGYGEWVMGSKGTMFLDKEGEVYLWREKDKSKKGDTGGRDTKITVTSADGKKPAMDASSTWGGGGAAGAPTKVAGGAPAWDSAVRGYRTELEHFAFCVREWQKRGGKVDYTKDANGELVHKAIIPRCHGEVAMADAILALTANMAMARRTRIEFEDGWFEATKEKLDDVPEAKYGSKKA